MKKKQAWQRNGLVVNQTISTSRKFFCLVCVSCRKAIACPTLQRLHIVVYFRAILAIFSEYKKAFICISVLTRLHKVQGIGRNNLYKKDDTVIVYFGCEPRHVSVTVHLISLHAFVHSLDSLVPVLNRFQLSKNI